MAIAGVGSRFLALLLDTLIQIGITLLALGVMVLLSATGILARTSEPPLWFIAGFITLGFLLFYGYYPIFEIAWSGQTPGKRIVGIRVVKDSGRPLTAGETIGRNLMRIVDQLPAFYVVGITVAMLNAKHKRLGDLLVGSVLVREASLADLKPIWHAPGELTGELHMDTSQLTAEDMALIDAFLVRRDHLDQGVRETTAIQILSRLRARVPSGIDLSKSAETILEALSHQKRSAGHLHR